jgi:CheY-like chemotaxis protein/anti-sigma regulatory factor (Ser/Thr protein kinase)
LAAARKIALETPSASDCGYYLLADRNRLRQALLNLLSNAVKYNRERGTVAVSCRHTDTNQVRICVEDTGYGIAASDMNRLFSPFERLREDVTIEGTGLGLALAKRLVEMMGGRITVESVVGTGSLFAIELPFANSPETEPSASPVPVTIPATAAANRTILYIEDNLSNLKLVERILAFRPGIRLISAMQGRLGLDLARLHAPDLILLDLNLPDMAGRDVLRTLRGEDATRDLPIIVISADVTSGEIGRMIAAGANAALTKPFTVTDFLAQVDKVLDLPTAKSQTGGER